MYRRIVKGRIARDPLTPDSGPGYVNPIGYDRLRG